MFYVRSCRRERVARRVFAALVGVFCLLPGPICPARAASPSDLQVPVARVRVEWSAAVAACWAGRIQAGADGIGEATSLGTVAGESGTLYIENGELQIARRNSATTDGCEFSVVARPGARLRVQMASAGDPLSEATVVEASLDDILRKPLVFEPQGKRPRLVVRRAPGDAITLRHQRDHWIFDPHERLQATILLNLLDLREPVEKPVRAHVRWRLTAVGGWWPLSEGAATVAAALNAARPSETPLEIALPREEGVYDLKLSASGRGFDDVERIVQLVVVERRPAERKETGTTEHLVDSFDPRQAGTARQMALPPGRKRREGTLPQWWKKQRDLSDASPNTEREQGRTVLRLKVAHPGRPHRLLMKRAATDTGELTVGVYATARAGRLEPLACRAHFAAQQPATSPNTYSGSEPEQTFELVFWPSDREPVVVFDRNGPAPDIEYVALYDLGEHLTAAPAPEAARPLRLCGPYIGEPRWVEAFAAPRVHEPSIDTPLDDWRTFLVAGNRLVEALRWQGANALMLAVCSDGNAVYPTSLLDSNLRYDNGRLSPQGRDAETKDLLELWLRLCDHAGLSLVPELQFNAALPALETMRRAGDPEGIELVECSGSQRSPGSGLPAPTGPRYNPLDPRVQQAVVNVVAELCERYGKHRAFAGVALRLGNFDCVNLPGIEWGYDAATIARFERAAGIRVPRSRDAAPDRCYTYLTTTARREWLKWRADEIAAFHRRLADIVVASSPEARLVLNGAQCHSMEQDPSMAAAAAVRAGRSPAQHLLSRGLDFSRYSSDLFVVMRPFVSSATGDAASQHALRTLNDSPAVDAAWQAGSRGALLTTLPARSHDAPRIVSAAGGALAAQEVVPARDLRRNYTRTLAPLDARMVFDGTGSLLWRPDDPARRFRAIITQLPVAPLEPSSSAAQPLAVRTARTAGATYICLANETSLALRGRIVLSTAADVSCVETSRGTAVALREIAGGRCELLFTLDEYDACCFRIANRQVSLHEVECDIDHQTLTLLKNRVERFDAQMKGVAELSQRLAGKIQNAGFEEPPFDRSEPPGWQTSAATGENRVLDSTQPRSGRLSLRFSATADDRALVSPELPLDDCRHALLAIWMRSNRASAAVEFSFDAEIGGLEVHRRQANDVGTKWKRYELRLENLPGGACRHARLRVEPLDECELWLDDMELVVQPVSADEVRQLTKIAAAMRLAWEQERFADCQRLLDGYWGRFLDRDAEAVPRQTAKPVSEARPKGLIRR